eukprot:GHVQ01032147.1.p1 GENE.GHVQ01032147.1~~GHVQ01032147.1.p1  ORF type:complete len:887 (+),score=155.48 GHVQ01032147.1:283-2943(+)
MTVCADVMCRIQRGAAGVLRQASTNPAQPPAPVVAPLPYGNGERFSGRERAGAYARGGGTVEPGGIHLAAEAAGRQTIGYPAGEGRLNGAMTANSLGGGGGDVGSNGVNGGGAAGGAEGVNNAISSIGETMSGLVHLWRAVGGRPVGGRRMLVGRRDEEYEGGGWGSIRGAMKVEEDRDWRTQLVPRSRRTVMRILGKRDSTRETEDDSTDEDFVDRDTEESDSYASEEQTLKQRVRHRAQRKDHMGNASSTRQSNDNQTDIDLQQTSTHSTLQNHPIMTPPLPHSAAPRQVGEAAPPTSPLASPPPSTGSSTVEGGRDWAQAATLVSPYFAPWVNLFMGMVPQEGQPNGLPSTPPLNEGGGGGGSVVGLSGRTSSVSSGGSSRGSPDGVSRQLPPHLYPLGQQPGTAVDYAQLLSLGTPVEPVPMSPTAYYPLEDGNGLEGSVDDRGPTEMTPLNIGNEPEDPPTSEMHAEYLHHLQSYHRKYNPQEPEATQETSEPPQDIYHMMNLPKPQVLPQPDTFPSARTAPAAATFPMQPPIAAVLSSNKPRRSPMSSSSSTDSRLPIGPPDRSEGAPPRGVDAAEVEPRVAARRAKLQKRVDNLVHELQRSDSISEPTNAGGPHSELSGGPPAHNQGPVQEGLTLTSGEPADTAEHRQHKSWPVQQQPRTIIPADRSDFSPSIFSQKPESTSSASADKKESPPATMLFSGQQAPPVDRSFPKQSALPPLTDEPELSPLVARAKNLLLSSSNLPTSSSSSVSSSNLPYSSSVTDSSESQTPPSYVEPAPFLPDRPRSNPVGDAIGGRGSVGQTTGTDIRENRNTGTNGGGGRGGPWRDVAIDESLKQMVPFFKGVVGAMRTFRDVAAAGAEEIQNRVSYPAPVPNRIRRL